MLKHCPTKITMISYVDREKTKQEVEHLDKEVLQEKDKLTTVLLTLVSRENNYAQLALELMKRKKARGRKCFRNS